MIDIRFAQESALSSHTDGDVIRDMVLMMEHYVSETDFRDCKGRWGYRGSESYLKKQGSFMRGMRNFAMNLPLKYYNGDFYRYDGRIYVVVEKGLLQQAYNQLLEYLDLVNVIGTQKYFDMYFCDVIRYYNPLVPRFDRVAFTNGVLDLTDFSFHDFSPEYHCTYMHPYRYDPTARCRKWLDFLHEVLPDKNGRLILQMFLGLGLIERGTVYNPYEGKDMGKVELCLLLIGSGNNGKSVITQTATGVFGKERISSLGYEELVAAGDEGMRNRLLLRNCIFNWSSDDDSRTFGKKRSGVFKRIVSGEPVTDRRIGHDVEENVNMPYLIFNINELPNPDDGGMAFIRRLQYVSFEVVIPKERQNKALAFELQKEYPGIFNWIVRGARELRRRKFVFPDSEGSRRQLLLTLVKKDPVAAWVKAYGMRPVPIVNGEVYSWVKASDLIASLERFCEDNASVAPSPQKFGAEMRSLGFFKKRMTNNQVYQVYGCMPESMSEPFVIIDADFRVDYVPEKGTLIEEDD